MQAALAIQAPIPGIQAKLDTDKLKALGYMQYAAATCLAFCVFGIKSVGENVSGSTPPDYPACQTLVGLL